MKFCMIRTIIHTYVTEFWKAYHLHAVKLLEYLDFPPYKSVTYKADILII